MLTGGIVRAQDPPPAAPAKIDLSQFPGTVVDEVIVPVPSEVFAVLDKLGNPNWRGELRKHDYEKITDRTSQALLFGAVVAQGFVAVEAEDKEAIKESGREVLRLSKSMGVHDSVVRHAQSIMDAADAGEWIAIRKELDRTQKTVRETMERMRDEDLAQCVSLGGWLRGTEALTSLISKSYTKDKAELLNQPELVEHFRSRIRRMNKKIRAHVKVVEVDKGLREIYSAMVRDKDMITPDTVREISTACRKLVELMTGGAGN